MGTRVSLCTTVRRYINEPDSANSNFTDAEIYDYLNQAIRYLGTEMEWPLQTAEATSVADQAVYTLPEDFISLSDVYFDNRNLTVLDRTDLPSVRNDWQNAEATTPAYAYKSDNAKIGLYPKPDTANAGKIIQIQYIKVPPDLSDDITAPDLHVVFQDCLPFYATFLCEHRMGNSKRADYNLALYESHKKKLMSKIQRFSDDSLRLRWTGPY
jgi:hypothetical protein